MKTGPLLFRITGIFVFIQLALGGLLTFDLSPAAPHIIVGFLVFDLAIATMAVAWTSKPAFKPVRAMSLVLVLLILGQIGLGFAVLGSNNEVLAWVHFLVALGIYGMTIAGTFMAMRWDQMSRRTDAAIAGI